MRPWLLAIAFVACKERPAPRSAPLDLSFEEARGLVVDTCATPLEISSSHHFPYPEDNALGMSSLRMLKCDLHATWGPAHADGIPRGLASDISLDRDGRPIQIHVVANVDNARALAFAHHVLERYLQDRELARSRLPSPPSSRPGQTIIVGDREVWISFEPAPADPNSTIVDMSMRHR